MFDSRNLGNKGNTPKHSVTIAVKWLICEDRMQGNNYLALSQGISVFFSVSTNPILQTLYVKKKKSRFLCLQFWSKCQVLHHMVVSCTLNGEATKAIVWRETRADACVCMSDSACLAALLFKHVGSILMIFPNSIHLLKVHLQILLLIKVSILLTPENSDLSIKK